MHQHWLAQRRCKLAHKHSHGTECKQNSASAWLHPRPLLTQQPPGAASNQYIPALHKRDTDRESSRVARTLGSCCSRRCTSSRSAASVLARFSEHTADSAAVPAACRSALSPKRMLVSRLAVRAGGGGGEAAAKQACRQAGNTSGTCELNSFKQLLTACQHDW
jgi:hypothetical protein